MFEREIDLIFDSKQLVDKSFLFNHVDLTVLYHTSEVTMTHPNDVTMTSFTVANTALWERG